MTHQIVFLDAATIPKHIPIPAPSFPHQWQSYETTSTEEILERVKDADIIITNKVILTADTLAQLPNLKLVAIGATGTNNVDLVACKRLGISVCNIQGYAAQSVSEHVLGMVFTLRRNLVGYHQDIQRGEWQKQNQFCFFTHPIGNIAGTTMGIIGRGNLGQAVAALARAVGMKVIFAEHKGAGSCREGYLPFEDVLAQSDVISLHCPLSEHTVGLINRPEFERMPNHAILINTGRGGLVDEVALINALKSGTIAGAGVDVFTEEPATQENPLLANADLPQLLLTPHVAWGSDTAITTLSNQLIENINRFIEGKPQNIVS